VNIVIEPRATLGELRIEFVGYCLHVLRSREGTTIAVEAAWRWIQ
jgi:hypothetical protein